MAQLCRDLCRDAYHRSGLLGLVGVWIRTLWDLVKTAASEHADALKKKGSLPKMHNRPVVPVSWPRVGLAILPGLFIIGTRSGLFEDMFGRRVSQVLEPNGLLVLSKPLSQQWKLFQPQAFSWSRLYGSCAPARHTDKCGACCYRHLSLSLALKPSQALCVHTTLRFGLHEQWGLHSSWPRWL